MNTGRMPACSASFTLLQGLNTTGVRQNNQNNEGDNTLLNELIQSKFSGNRCGHDRNNFKKPSFYESTGGVFRRPYTIQESLRRIGCIIGFKRLSGNERRRLHASSFRKGDEGRNGREYRRCMSILQKKESAGLFYHLDKTGELRRKKRSESIEASLSLVVRALLYRFDVHTMAYGYRDGNNKTIYLDYHDLKEDTEVSYSRIKKVMRSLQKEGFITVKRIMKQLDNGNWICIETQIHLTDKIFKWLGLEEQLLKDRRYALAQNFKKQTRIDERNKHLQEYSSSQKTTKNIIVKKTVPLNKDSYPTHTIAQNKNVLNIAAKIMADNPQMILRDAIMIAAERNKAPPN
jgi:hypothetical protein